MDQVEYRWLTFVLIRKGGKTNVYFVKNKTQDLPLGEIMWNAQWRKYCFYPSAGTVFDSECLKDVCHFTSKLMLDRKIEKQNASQ